MEKHNIETVVTVDGEKHLDLNNADVQILLAKVGDTNSVMAYGTHQELFEMILDTVEVDPHFGAVIGLVCTTIINAPEEYAPPEIIAVKNEVRKATIEIAKESGLYEEAMKYAAKKAKEGGFE